MKISFSAPHGLLWVLSTAPMIVLLVFIATSVRRDMQTFNRLRDDVQISQPREFKLQSRSVDVTESPLAIAESHRVAKDGGLLYLAAESLLNQARTIGLLSTATVDFSDPKVFVSAPLPGSEWPQEPIASLFLQHASPLIQTLHSAALQPNAVWAWEHSTGNDSILQILQLEFQHAHYHGQTERAVRAIKTASGLNRMTSGKFLDRFDQVNPDQDGLDVTSGESPLFTFFVTQDLMNRIAVHQMIYDALGEKGYDSRQQWANMDEVLQRPISIDRLASDLLRSAKQVNPLPRQLSLTSVRWQDALQIALVDVEQLATESSRAAKAHDWDGRDTVGWIEGAASRLSPRDSERSPRQSLTTPLIGEFGRTFGWVRSRGSHTSFLILAAARVEEDRRMLRLAIALKIHSLQGEADTDSWRQAIERAKLPESETLDLYSRPFQVQKMKNSESGFVLNRVSDRIGEMITMGGAAQLTNSLGNNAQLFLNWNQRRSIVVR